MIKKARKGMDFVIKNANNDIQSQKIYDYLNNLVGEKKWKNQKLVL